LIAIADVDGDGQISFYEFVTAFANQYSEINPNNLKQKFPV
jgi:Ca2+-binding EF-hand superfamily protein